MPVNLVSDDELRAALRPFRTDPHTFETNVRARLKAAETECGDDPLAGSSPLLRSAAAFLPLAILTGCKVTRTAAKESSAGGASMVLGYLAFPAISLFILLGATVFSVVKLRRLRAVDGSEHDDPTALQDAIRQWWIQHKWGAFAVFAVTVILSLVGATWLLFVMYIISFGILLYVVASFAKLGLGNRLLIGSCSAGLILLGQLAAIPGIGNRDIHFLDQILVAALFFAGALILLLISLVNAPCPSLQVGTVTRRTLAVLLLVPLIAWMLKPILWPDTPARIKHYVESFDQAPYKTVSWLRWEIVASWAIQSKLDPDLSQPRRLLDQEISGSQNPFILGSALRVGLLSADQLGQLRDYEEQRRFLVDEAPSPLPPQVITSIDQYDWVIRAAVLQNDLSPRERDLLEQRLHATLENLLEIPHVVLSEPLRVTQLLELLGRPVKRDQYREKVHHLLRNFHTKDAGGFQFAGGFKWSLNWPAEATSAQPGALEPTAHAVALMEIYGVPADLDLNWVRSFLRPSIYRLSDDKWVAAATLDRLRHLPGVTQPTWLDFLYYERTLLAAAVLVGLCLYATLCSPIPKAMELADGTITT